jgi:uncharacterized membrane protein
MHRCLAIIAIFTGSQVFGQSSPPPAPPSSAEAQRPIKREPPPPKPDGRDHDDHMRRPYGPPGGNQGGPSGPSRDMRDGKQGPFGRPRNDAWEKLSEEDKSSIRRAFESAWEQPAVTEARDRAMRANAEMREALMNAIEKIDPHAHKLIQTVRPEIPSMPMGMGMPKPQLPRTDDPDFPRAAINRLRMEMMGYAKPEHREAAEKLHLKVMLLPAVVTANEALIKASPEARMEAFKRLHEVYKTAVEAEITEAKHKQSEKLGK